MADYNIDVVLQAKEDGMSVFSDMRDHLAALVVQSAAANAALGPLTDKTSSAGSAASTATTSILGLALPTYALITAIVAASLSLSPFIALVIATTVVVSAFAIGALAAGAALLLAFGGLAALGMLIFTLANNHGQLATQLANVHVGLTNMTNQLGDKAAPMASRFLDLVTGLTPYIGNLGLALLHWFGPRLESILGIAQRSFFDLTDALYKAGPVFGAFIDKMIARFPEFDAIFRLILKVGVEAVSGLLDNLLKLTDWFMARMPAMVPIVLQAMGALGTAIQDVARVGGLVVDFFLKNWPEIKKAAEDSWKSIAQGWAMASPFLVLLIAAFQGLRPEWEFVRAHADELRGYFVLLGIAAAIVVGALFLLGAALLALIGGLEITISTWQRFITWAGNAGKAVQDWGSQFGEVFRVAQGLADGLLATLNLLAHAHVPVPAVGGAGGAVGGVMAGLLGIGEHEFGGLVAGSYIGQPRLIVAHAGERVQTVAEQASGGRPPLNVTMYIQGASDPEAIAMIVNRRLAALVSG